MKTVILFIIILAFSDQLNAQNYDLPPNPIEGKCYVKSFKYDKKFKWKIIDCEKAKREAVKEKSTREKLKDYKERVKLIKYQEKLVKLGYNVHINGVVDNKTINAHHKYLKKKRK